jgi:ElaB/YqjD/DUF883 family membrane-anchored ribosome-binding protein
MKKKHKTDSIKRELNNIIADIDSLLKESASLTGDEFSDAREKLHEKIATAKESILEISSDFSHRAQRTAAKANLEVHEDPWKAIGIGAVAGLLLGVLFTRR